MMSKRTWIVWVVVACGSNSEPDDKDAAAIDMGAADSAPSDGPAADICTDCPKPSCSIACFPHEITAGESTTFFWMSDGQSCHLSCTNGVDMDVACEDENKSNFQNIQQTETCTLSAQGPGPLTMCQESVFVL
jgi:hypothetical protein